MSREISKEAKIGENARIGENVVIEAGAVVGDNVAIGHNVVVYGDVVIGNDCKIASGSILGKRPAKAANSAVTGAPRELAPLTIGDDVTIGALCVIYAGAKIASRAFFGDLSSVRENVEIGEETIIGRGATVENDVKIGRKTKIETNAYITAFSEIGDYCFAAPGVVFSNDNRAGRTEERKKHFKGATLKKGSRVGAGAVLLPGVTMEEDAFAAAGSVVTKDAPAKTIVAGVPAKPFREVPKEQLLEEQVFYER